MSTACKAIFTLFSLGLLFFANYANAQAKFAVGGGGALSYSKENIPGFGVVGQGEVRLNNNLSIVPSMGAEVPYVVYAGLVLRYYIDPKLYIHLGGFVNAEGEVFSDNGGGPTAGIGYIVMVKKDQSIDLNFHADNKRVNDKSLGIFGIRLIYSYSFTTLSTP